MKKTGLIALIAGGVLALGGGSVYAANQIARGSAIGEDAARNFALVDAGILPEDANILKTEFDFEHGRFVYEVDFTANGVKYEYQIDSKSGAVIDKEWELLPASERTSPAVTAAPAATAQTAEQSEQKEWIPIEQAKQIALDQAGIRAEEVTFSKTKLEREDGRQVYEVEFYIAGNAKYEYSVDAASGEIIEESIEAWEPDDYEEYNVPREPAAEAAASDEAGAAIAAGGQSGTSQQSAPASQSAQASQSGGAALQSQPTQSGASQGSAAQPSQSSTQQSSSTTQSAQAGQQSSGTASASTQQAAAQSAQSGQSGAAQQSQSTQSAQTSQPAQQTTTTTPAPVKDIGVDRAKSIALSHAGVSAGSAVFSKAKQDREDGVLVYDIEFYVSGVAEYEVEIDAATGAIREYDVDWWEPDDDDDWDDDDD